MALPTNNTSLILAENYKQLFDSIIDVIGTNENGYGLKDFSSSPVSTGTNISVFDWNNLYDDIVNVAWTHITNATTSTQTLTSGVSNEVFASFHNQLYNLVNYITTNRYKCSNDQYFRDPINNSSLNIGGGQSTRTSPWGGGETLEIQHRVKTKWTTRLNARYFFNTGGFFTWTPYHLNNGFNDLDAEWAGFIRSIQIDQETNPLIYDRDKFVNQISGSTLILRPQTTTLTGSDPTYESGTLSITVEVLKASNEQSLEFIITFNNSNSSILVIEPEVGYWNEQV